MSSYNIYIILPGTTGSTLVDGLAGYNPKYPTWPDLVYEAATNQYIPDPKAAASMLETSLLYAGIVCGWNTSGSGYASLAAAISAAAGATPVSAEAPFIDPTTITATAKYPWELPSSLTTALVIGFAYDWRQDNTTSAKMLQNLLYNINRLYDNVGQVFLIGHSMGGIVARTYLEVVGSASDPLYANITNLITLGTPHLGAQLAFDAVIDNLDITKYMGPILTPQQADDIEIMANDFVDNTKYPSDSTYELLPPPSVQFITDEDNSTLYSVFDQNLPMTINDENADDLTSAQTLLTELLNRSNSSIPYYCIYGVSSAYPTCTGITYTSLNGFSDVATANGGDQIVPTSSAQFQGAKNVVSWQAQGSVNHMQLPGNSSVQTQVLTWLGLGS